MISGVCPSCGLCGDLEVFLLDADDKAALVAALNLPHALARQVLRYLKLFSPPQRALTGKKKRRLLEELAAQIMAAEVSRNGVAHPAPLAYWEEAMDKILSAPPAELPLQNHHYLFQVVWNIGQRASKLQAQRAEDDRHRQPAARRSGALRPVTQVVDRAAGKQGAARLRQALKPPLRGGNSDPE